MSSPPFSSSSDSTNNNNNRHRRRRNTDDEKIDATSDKSSSRPVRKVTLTDLPSASKTKSKKKYDRPRSARSSNRVFSSNFYLGQTATAAEASEERGYATRQPGIVRQCIFVAGVGVCGTAFIVLILLLSIFRPFSSTKYQRYANYAFSSFLDVMAFLLPDMEICLSKDSDWIHSMEHAIILCNPLDHVNNDGRVMDFLILCLLGRCLGLKGSMKLVLPMGFKNAPFKGSFCGVVLGSFLHYFMNFPLELRNGGGSSSGKTTLPPVQYIFFPKTMKHNVDDTASCQSVIAFGQQRRSRSLSSPLLTNASVLDTLLENLAPYHPVILDVTMACQHHHPHHSPQSSSLLSPFSNLPPSVHIRIKRYSAETITANGYTPSFLYKISSQKQNSLHYFHRHQRFSSSSSSMKPFCLFSTKYSNIEYSLLSALALTGFFFFWPLCIPWVILSIWILTAYKISQLVFNHHPQQLPTEKRQQAYKTRESSHSSAGNVVDQTRSPFCPATPFASPLIECGWNRENNN